MNSVKVFSPASVSNVCCGFDVLGFSIAGLGDELIITESDSNKVNIIKVNGYGVPLSAINNTASVVFKNKAAGNVPNVIQCDTALSTVMKLTGFAADKVTFTNTVNVSVNGTVTNLDFHNLLDNQYQHHYLYFDNYLMY